METLKNRAKKKNPRENASFLSKLTFWYMNKVVSEGYRKDLDVADLFTTLESLSSCNLSEDLKRNLEEEQKKKGEHFEQNAFLTFTKANRTLLISLGLWQFFEEASHVINGFLVGYLIEYFIVGAKDGDKSSAITYATTILALSCVVGIFHHSIDYSFECLGLKLRSAISSMVYEKVTRLSQGAFAHTSAGNVINLVSSDTQKLLMVFYFFNYLWISPLKLCCIFVLLYLLLDVSAIPGMVLLLLFIPLQLYFGKLFARLRKSVGSLTDERVKITSEVIKGMRAIKMYAWEKPFSEIIKESRRKEIEKILKTQIIRATNTSLFVCMPYLCSAVMFTTHYLRGKQLTTTIVFSTLAILQLVRFSLCIFFPIAMQRLAEAIVSIKRVKEFLNLDEQVCTNLRSKDLSPEDPLPYVKFCNVKASWLSDESSPTLSDVNLEVEKEKPLLTIIGTVGSSKTSILMAICGEIPLLNGSVTVNGRISYSSQVPWIFSGTVRRNILFGEVFDAAKYNAVITSCALAKDFEQFPMGDMTLVGERGVCVSGGQKARISLARAVYRSADIYLLDDPLSAVDSQVGNHIFEHCICGYLKDKIRILVTHQIQFLESTSKVLCIEKGRVVSYGTYDEISQANFDVNSLLSEISAKDVEDDTVILPEHADLMFTKHQTKHHSADKVAEIIPQDPQLSFSGNSKTEEIQDEKDIKQGSIGVKLYIQFFSAGGGTFVSILMVLICVLSQLSLTGVDWWIAEWSSFEETKLRNKSSISQHLKYFSDNSNNNNPLYLYLGWIFVTCCLVLFSVYFFFYVIVNVSKDLHNKMTSSILKAPMFFFDTTQTGVILNRFAKDTFFLDDELPWTFQEFIMYFLFTVNAVVINCINIPYLIVAIVILLGIFIYLTSYYLVTGRKIKRLEGISRSPMFAHFSETLEGLPTIRASKAVDLVTKEFYECQDHQSDGWYLYFSATRWFGQRLDAVVIILITVSIYGPIIVVEYTAVNPALVGLSLVYILQLCIFFQWCVRQSAQVENYMTSAERIIEYCNLKAEQDVTTSAPVSREWPKFGRIEASNVSFAYHSSLPMVLKDLSFVVNAGEKVGVIGRTGAGKSSIFSLLFRNGAMAGDLRIDDVPVNEVSLQDWRKSLSIIPQDPVLFSGNLRINIDPFSTFTDSEIWDVLEQVELKDHVANRPRGLLSSVSEGGSNFSVGQKQLLCLARALLLEKKVLLIDEATANVDTETDALIQTTIREKFINSTVITIAHRLNTIIDCDRIMVLDSGEIVQFDEPCRLFTQRDGIFYQLVAETGKEHAEELEKMAFEVRICKRDRVGC